MIKAKKLLFLINTLFVISCGEPESGNYHKPEKADYEKALITISNFDLEKTNGYDFSLEQYFGNYETNSSVVSLRADFSGNIKAKKSKTTKRLSTYETGEQYLMNTEITYFSNNMICEYEVNKWKWSNYKKNDYFEYPISQIDFDRSYFESITEKKDSKYVFTAVVPDSKVKAFFKSETATFTGVAISFALSADFLNFESLELQYSQNKTRSELKLEIYRGAVNITLPN